MIMKMKSFFTIMVGVMCLGLVAPARAELVAHWQFEGDLTDATGNGNDGSIAIGTVGYASGMDGSAIKFDGGDAVSLPVTVGPDWSVGCWYLSTLPLNNGMFIATGYRYSGGPTNIGGWESMFIRPWMYYDIHRVTGAMDWNAWWDYDADGHFGEWNIEPSVWHHVILTYSGDGDNTWTFYIDGIKVSDGNIDFPGWQIIDDESQMTIGGAYARLGLIPDYDYAGLVDELQLYDHVLTEADVFGIFYPRHAFIIAPEDGSVTYDTEVTLQWLAPLEAEEPPVTYDVYLGTDPNEESPHYYGNDPIVSGISETSTSSGTLEAGNTYFWRVDVIDPNNGSPCRIRGFEKSFSIASTISKGLVGHWKFDGDLSDSAEGRTGTALGNPSTDTDNGIDGGAAEFDGSGDAIILSTEGLGGRFEWTVMCWVNGDILEYPEYVGNNGMFLTSGYDDDPYDGVNEGWEAIFMRYYYGSITGAVNWPEWAVSGAGHGENGHTGEWPIEPGNWYHVTVSYDAITREVNAYLNGALMSTSTADFPGFYNKKMAIGAAQAADETLGVEYDGLVDDVRLYDCVLEELEIARIINPEGAVLPSPMDGAMDVARNAELSWIPGEGTESFKVYMTSDPNDALIMARDPSLLVSEQTETTYDPDPELEWGIHYYWCVDEVHDGGATIVPSDVWEFTVAFGLTCDPLPGDLDDDCFVTISDVAIMSANWLVCSYNNEDCP
jgi:hypothetical protein